MFRPFCANFSRVILMIATVVACGSDDEDGTTGPGDAGGSGGGGSGGTGGTSTGGTGGTSSGGSAGTAGTGGSAGTGTGGAATGGAAGAGGSAGTAGSLGCPASIPVDQTEWDTSPWVVPMSGNTLQTITVSNEIGLHYERFEMDVDVTTGPVGTPFVCFAELRNQTSNHSVAWRYFALCVKTDNPPKLINHVFTPATGRVETNFTMRPNTSYHVSYAFDARISEATATIVENGGSPVSATSSPISSSISPQGSGLRLLMGISESHPDVIAGNIVPPYGWTFENLVIHLDPGGPFGSEALPCR